MTQPVTITKPTKECRVCGKDIPASARFCTECEHWQNAPHLILTAQVGNAVIAVAASLGLPLLLFWAASSYEKVQAATARADTAAEREAQVLQALSTALDATISVSGRFRAGVAQLEAACTPPPAPTPGADAKAEPRECSERMLDALSVLDDVVSSVSWTIDTVPVRSDTYARATNLKYDYFRGCKNDEQAERCGYRQRVLWYLHGQGFRDQPIALKRCVSSVSDADRAKCVTTRESMKRQTLAPMRDHVNDILCSVTRDANELRIRTWKKMDSGSLSYQELAGRLQSITEHSDCARRLRERPLPADCRFGMGLDGKCL